MAAKRGFKAVALEDLSDEQLEELVLSNWHKLNTALKHGQSADTLRRLLRLELRKGASARPNVAERIRSALFRVLTVRASQELANALAVLVSAKLGLTAKESLALHEALMAAGLTDSDANDVIYETTQEEQ
jgi:hypothetical protein